MPRLATLLFLVLAACDPVVRSEVAGTYAAAPAAARGGRPYESCAATRDCAEPLRCVDGSCVPEQSSRLGEYLWAAGRRAADRGVLPVAVTAFQQAVAQYETDRAPVPPALLCDQGTVLRRKGEPPAGEQAARLLHRCLLGTPAGSRVHDAALRELVELQARGLDPALLARDTPADSYLVNKPTAPGADALVVEVARTTPSSDKGYDAWVKVLEGPDGRAALARCFAASWEKTLKPRMAFALPLKLRAKTNDDDQVVGGTLDFPPDPALDENGRCARAALAPLAAELAKSAVSSASWQGAVTITVSAP